MNLHIFETFVIMADENAIPSQDDLVQHGWGLGIAMLALY
jgi:hypothetical protein